MGVSQEPMESCLYLGVSKVLAQRSKRKPANLIIFSLLHKECFPIVPELHMQIHWFSIDLHVHLQDRKKT